MVLDSPECIVTSCSLFYSLRKAKTDQRKLNDNANSLVDMGKVRLAAARKFMWPKRLIVRMYVGITMVRSNSND